ncbi:MAG: pilus assembly protein PilP [Magnetococcales bacterium]|nr:pilus assembly protein PilP [Magnetococcales bacterium]
MVLACIVSLSLIAALAQPVEARRGGLGKAVGSVTKKSLPKTFKTTKSRASKRGAVTRKKRKDPLAGLSKKALAAAAAAGLTGMGIKLTPKIVAYLNQKEEEDIWRYQPRDSRDPFQSPIALIKQLAEEEEDLARPAREPEPLEQFELTSLKLVGVIHLEAESVAMVQDPVGKGYTVRVGHYMGMREGRIIRIGDSEVELLENNPTPRDRNATRLTVIRLHEKE